jgi:hypothetical protein
MLIDWLTAAGVTVASALLGLIPEWSPNLPDFVTMGTTIGGSAGLFNGYVPVFQLFVVLMLYLGLRAALMLWHLAKLAYSLVPFKAT